jgi:hypothetical protein
MRCIIKAFLFVSLLLSSFCGCDSDDGSGIYCVEDKICHIECKTDPDCAKKTTSPSGVGGNPNRVGTGGRSFQTTDDSGAVTFTCPKGSLEAKSAVDFERFYGCTEIAGDLSVESASVTDFKGLETVTSIGGSLILRDNKALTSLNGLNGLKEIAGDITITYNTKLGEVNALAGLTQVGGNLQIRANTSLANLNGFVSLTSVGGSLYIRANTALRSLEGLRGLSEVKGSLDVGQNTALPTCEVQELFNRVRGQGRNCENRADNCGSDECPSVW